MKERDLLKWATDVLDRTGWEWWHVPAPMVAGKNGQWRPYRKAAGLPDVFALHRDPARLLIIETKGTGGSLTEKQRLFLEMARAVAFESWSWEDDDLEAPHGSPIGVVVLLPGMEDAFERMCKSKVMSSS